MIPLAYISHQIPHRTRIRIPGERNGRSYFSRVERELGKLKGVESIQVQPLTASILIQHRCPVRALTDYSREHDLFELKKVSPSKPWADQLLSKFEVWDEELMLATDGQWDLLSMTAVGLVGVSLYQAFRKQLFPPAWSLLGNAAVLLNQSRKEKVRKAAA